ncbi:MAG: hypothetical protein JWL84_6245 [Rhodospirillales bacterium]|jgi:hypothetical protein|nr:hypothetical protein [Rhodospirillales bacterium]
MKHTIVRYRTRPEAAAENQRLIEDVFRELHAASPDGIGYAVFRLPDGSFVHLVETADGSAQLTELAAFKTFAKGVKERCLEPPQSSEATIVGNYRVLGAAP